jgi:hypothetical protein
LIVLNVDKYMNTHEHMDFAQRSNSKPRYYRSYKFRMPETDDQFDVTEYQKARAKHIAKGGENNE